MDEFVKILSSEIDMLPGKTKAISKKCWKIIKTIHFIAPSNEQVISAINLPIE